MFFGLMLGSRGCHPCLTRRGKSGVAAVLVRDDGTQSEFHWCSTCALGMCTMHRAYACSLFFSHDAVVANRKHVQSCPAGRSVPGTSLGIFVAFSGQSLSRQNIGRCRVAAPMLNMLMVRTHPSVSSRPRARSSTVPCEASSPALTATNKGLRAVSILKKAKPDPLPQFHLWKLLKRR